MSSPPQPLSKWQSQRGGVRLCSAHLRHHLLLHRLLPVPGHTAWVMRYLFLLILFFFPFNVAKTDSSYQGCQSPVTMSALIPMLTTIYHNSTRTMTLHWCKEYCRGRPDLIWVSFLQCYIICISPFQFFLETNQTNIRVNQVLMLDFLHELRTITYLTNIRLSARTWLWYVRKPGGKIPVSIWPLFVIFFFFLVSVFPFSSSL